MSWYVESLLGSTPSAREKALSELPPDLITLLAEEGLTNVESKQNEKLPRELMEMVRDQFNADKDALPMTVAEAKEHREALMKERSAFHQTAEAGWQQHSYSFCEH